MQITERRVAGSKIIDAQLDSQRSQVSEGLGRHADVLHDDAFCYLEFQAAGIQTRGLQRLDYLLQQTGIPELLVREVDAHRQIVLLGSSVEPSLHLQAGFLQNMTAYWHDKAGLFGHSNEMLGHDQALFGVSPPYQRLESTHSAGREVNYGLEKN